MHSKTHPSAGGTLAALCLGLLLACTEQEPGGHPGGERPALVSLSLLQAGVTFGDPGFVPRPVPFAPEVFHPDSLEYAAKVWAGTIAILPDPLPRHGVSVLFRGAPVAESRWRDGRPCFLVEMAEDGELEVVVEDSAGAGQVGYLIRLDVKALADPESPSLAAMALEQLYYYRYPTYMPEAMTPGFHPDSLEYAANPDEDSRVRLIIEPAIPGSELTVRYNDSILQPDLPAGDKAYFSARFASPGTFTTTVKDILSGRSRSYTLSLRKSLPMNSGEWTPVGSLPGNLGKVDFVDGRIGYILNTLARFRKTTDGGKTWVDPATPPVEGDGYVREFDFADADTGYLMDGRFRIRKTTDGGDHWAILHTVLPGPSLVSPKLAFPTARIGYVAAGTSVFRTRDGGTGWVETPTGMASDIKELVFVSPSMGFISDYDGKVRKTRDGGESWQEVSGTLVRVGHTQKIFALDSSTLFVSLGNAITRTLDGGGTWSTSELPIDFRILDFVFTDARTGYMAVNESAKGSSLFKTVDGGSTWTPQYRGDITFRRLVFPEAGTGYAFGTRGELMKLSR